MAPALQWSSGALPAALRSNRKNKTRSKESIMDYLKTYEPLIGPTRINFPVTTIPA